MDETIEGKVDAVLSGHASSKPMPTMKHTRRLFGRRLPRALGLLLLVGVVGAMLSSGLWTLFTVQIQGDVELTGAGVPCFTWDGQPFAGQFYNTTPDVTSMTAGDHFEYSHTLANADNWAWLVTLNDSFLDTFYCAPMHPWYGFNFSVLDAAGDPVVWPVMFTPGESFTWTFAYDLNHEFVTSEDPMVFDIALWINMTNSPPVANDDSLQVIYAQGQDLDPTLNDADYEGDPITVVGFQAVTGLTVTQQGNVLHIENWHAVPGSTVISFWVDVSDGFNDPVREWVHVTCVL